MLVYTLLINVFVCKMKYYLLKTCEFAQNKACCKKDEIVLEAQRSYKVGKLNL